MIKLFFDYDNTIVNCDSDYLWGYLLYKLNIFNFKKKKINNFFYYLYEKIIINNFCYLKLFNFFFLKIKKIKIIFNYLKKIFYNYNFYEIIKKNIVSTSTNYYILYNKFKIYKNYLFCSNIKKINIKNNKILNSLKIKNEKKIFISDSINDIYFFFYNKNNIINNSDLKLYLFKNTKFINRNNIYK
ncbi:hypothetical protein CUN91_00635 [Candidatus Carsonella ruddii]|uniref:Phosphoserine phosphatase n=1 Tax=Carsonella ruddii TaxID=114186 RepID=A0A2K8K8V7_CARRU|nr:hypothetical protein [Candidatus Carsonella ruddii]ATX33461.1 hypothetical protein CUN91_00635 [Candidatus Carsonella ruddii]